MSRHTCISALLLAASVAMSATGCTSAPVAPGSISFRTITDGASFAMAPGETVTLSDRSTLRYVSVESDSRCPPHVQCIHAGNAVVGFESRPAAGTTQSFELNSPDQPQSRDLGSLHVMLQSLAFGAAPQAQLKVERDP